MQNKGSSATLFENKKNENTNISNRFCIFIFIIMVIFIKSNLQSSNRIHMLPFWEPSQRMAKLSGTAAVSPPL
jgi:hypothetical protein